MGEFSQPKSDLALDLRDRRSPNLDGLLFPAFIALEKMHRSTVLNNFPCIKSQGIHGSYSRDFGGFFMRFQEIWRIFHSREYLHYDF